MSRHTKGHDWTRLALDGMSWLLERAITAAFLVFALLGAAAIAQQRPHILGDPVGWILQSVVFLWWGILRLIADTKEDQ